MAKKKTAREHFLGHDLFTALTHVFNPCLVEQNKEHQEKSYRKGEGWFSNARTGARTDAHKVHTQSTRVRTKAHTHTKGD